MCLNGTPILGQSSLYNCQDRPRVLSTQQIFIEHLPVTVGTKMTQARSCLKTSKHLLEGVWEWS